jgi:hypothetical protein
MCFLLLTVLSKSCQWLTGCPYFFSMEGKYEAGPLVFVSSVTLQTPFLLGDQESREMLPTQHR